MPRYRAAVQRPLSRRLLPRRRAPRYALFALVPAVVAAALVAALLPGAGPSHTADPLGGPARRTPAEGAKPVSLVTGDSVRLISTAGGRSTVVPAPAKLARDSAVGLLSQTFTVGGDTYSVPGEALPFLDTLLDPRLFDVSYLQRAGYTDLDALPVTVTWHSAKHTPVPGLTAPRTGRTTGGTIGTSTAGEFGQALTDLASAKLHKGTKLSAAAKALAQVEKISLAPPPAATPAGAGPAGAGAVGPGSTRAAAAPAAASPHSGPAAGTRLYTLTVNPISVTGKPGYALVYIQDLTTFARYYRLTTVLPGDTAALSVPAGSYAIEAIVADIDTDLNLAATAAFVPVPQVDVAADTTVTVDARGAQPINISVPDPGAAASLATMSFARTSADGNGLAATFQTFGPGMADFVPEVKFYAKPTPQPRVGSLGFADGWTFVPRGTGASGGDVDYSYNLDFASDQGVPAALSHTVAPGDLATVHEGFAASVPGDAMLFSAAPFHSWSPLTVALSPTFFGFPVPSRRTDYFGGTATTAWRLVSQATGASGYLPFIVGSLRTFQRGEQESLTWGASPSVPAPEWENMGVPAGPISEGGRITESYICPVCRQGDVLGFSVVPSGDNDPTHTENWDGLGSGVLSDSTGGPTDVLKFYRDGVLTQTATGSGLALPMLPGKANYTIDWASTSRPDLNRLATSVHSVWTFSSARPKTADRLPAYELCNPDTTQPCSFVPLVFASYDFGTNLSGEVSAPGAQTFTVTGYHEAGAVAPDVRDASVQVSYDDGATWSPAAVTGLGGGRFRAAITAPDPSATSGYVSVKVKLADSAGNALEQTILRAYALSGQATK